MADQEVNRKSADVIPLKARKCPMCGKPAETKFRPFCSRRCANLDLGNWLGEVYRAPTDEPMEEEDFDQERE